MNRKSHAALAALATAALLGGCAYDPYFDDEPDSVPVAAQPQPASLTKVYFYPTQGQSDAQQDRDRYDCYVWAVNQTGFDPSRHLAPQERETVVPQRSRNETVGTAAAVGAVIGAVAGGSGDRIEGAVVGGVAGAMVGAAASNAQESEARAAQARSNRRGAGRYEREAGEYRRAMSACLEGRGYSVR